MEAAEARVYEVLKKLDIKYKKTEHEAYFTVAQAEKGGFDLPGINVKNLIVRDKKTEEHYMVILEDFRRLDFRALGKITGWSSKMTFADDDKIFEYTGVHIGSCSVFGLINDRDRRLTVVLEKLITSADPEDMINFHPNVNTATLSIKIKDMYRFLEWTGNRVIEEK